jgi:hypothetical protein
MEDSGSNLQRGLPNGGLRRGDYGTLTLPQVQVPDRLENKENLYWSVSGLADESTAFFNIRGARPVLELSSMDRSLLPQPLTERAPVSFSRRWLFVPFIRQLSANQLG